MKLQVNLYGSWRDVIEFGGGDINIEVVKILGRRLLALAEGRVSMRIADDHNVEVEHLGSSKEGR